MSDLRSAGFRMPNGERPYSDQDYAVLAVHEVLCKSELESTHWPELSEQLAMGQFSAIHRGAVNMVRLVEAELKLWRDLEDETSFALAGAH